MEICVASIKADIQRLAFIVDGERKHKVQPRKIQSMSQFCEWKRLLIVQKKSYIEASRGETVSKLFHKMDGLEASEKKTC